MSPRFSFPHLFNFRFCEAYIIIRFRTRQQWHGLFKATAWFSWWGAVPHRISKWHGEPDWASLEDSASSAKESDVEDPLDGESRNAIG